MSTAFGQPPWPHDDGECSVCEPTERKHHVAALRALIAAGVVVVDQDEKHHANVRGLGGAWGAGGSYVKSLGGDYDTEHSSPPTFSYGEDNGTWRVLAVRPDVLDAACSD